jgi:hypothetical protein
MIGENYLQLAEFLKIKANYYQKIRILTSFLSRLLPNRLKLKTCRKIPVKRFSRQEPLSTNLPQPAVC